MLRQVAITRINLLKEILMERVTEDGNVVFNEKNGMYYVWNGTCSDFIIETPNVDLAFEVYRNYVKYIDEDKSEDVIPMDVLLKEFR
jgi:hypothetical protein